MYFLVKHVRNAMHFQDKKRCPEKNSSMKEKFDAKKNVYCEKIPIRRKFLSKMQLKKTFYGK
jgi:hypothetical protein